MISLYRKKNTKIWNQYLQYKKRFLKGRSWEISDINTSNKIVIISKEKRRTTYSNLVLEDERQLWKNNDINIEITQ